MGDITFRYKKKEERLAATYWRRRFFALVGGLAIFALLAWSVSGAIGGVKTMRPAASVVTGHQHRPAGSGGRPSGSGGQPAGRPSAAPTAAPSATPSGPAGHHPAGKHHRAAGPHPGRKARRPSRPKGRTPPKRPAGPARPARHGRGRGSPRACASGNVVLSLFASQVSYPAHARPVFDVDVVSTKGRTCTFNVGARSLALVIRAGRDRVWSSADCPQGRKSLFTDLVRGVPTVLSIAWDRRTSSPGCRLARAAVPAGMYTATVTSGPLASNREIFRIR